MTSAAALKIISAAVTTVKYIIEDGRFRVGNDDLTYRDVKGAPAAIVREKLGARVWRSRDALISVVAHEVDVMRIKVGKFGFNDNNPDGKAICNGADLIPDQLNPKKWEKWLVGSVFHDVGRGGGRAEEFAAFLGVPVKVVNEFWDALFGAEVGGLEGRGARGIFQILSAPWLWLKRHVFTILAVASALTLAGCSGCAFFAEPLEIVGGSDTIITTNTGITITNKFTTSNQ